MDSTKTTRVKSQNKFLLCFKPVAVEDQPLITVNDDSGDHMLAYVPVADRDNVVVPTISPEYEVGRDGKKKGYKHLFFRALKESKKNKRKKLQNKSSKGKNDSTSKPDKISNVRNKKLTGEESFEKSSNVRMHSSIASSVCSSSSSERNKSLRRKSINEKFEEHEKGWYGSRVGGILLILSLFVLVFWGKTCSIFCTSTWLFFFPRWNGRFVSPENGSVLPEIDSVEYKKKIIMEGLLERNRFRGIF